MNEDVKSCRAGESDLMVRIAEDVVLAYKITERELDEEQGDNIQSVRTYTADGNPNDKCLLDHKCERHFDGRPSEQIRFRPGDIVEVIGEWQAELCVVCHSQLTAEDYEIKRQYWLENHKKKCQKWGIEYKEDEVFHWDYSDDCYLAYKLGEGDTHFHPESYKVFRPTKPVPKSLRAKLKAKYEEQLREEEERKNQKEFEKNN